MKSARKRVSQVGSGAYSIYLPKKWIDGWSREQKLSREVDVRAINDSLLIAPAHVERRLEAILPDDAGTVRAVLLSAYIRGARDVKLTSTPSFSTPTVLAARELLRHLDERLVATVSSTSIGYRLPADAPLPVNSGLDLLWAMAEKADQILDIASEAVTGALDDPAAALHGLRLLASLRDEDLRRQFCQALRLVATVELPMTSVSDFQLLDLAAAELWAVGLAASRLEAPLLAEHGFGPGDLAYPVDDLMRRIAARGTNAEPGAATGATPAPSTAPAVVAAASASAPERAIHAAAALALRDAREVLATITAGIRDPAHAAFGKAAGDAGAAIERMRGAAFDAIGRAALLGSDKSGLAPIGGKGATARVTPANPGLERVRLAHGLVPAVAAALDGLARLAGHCAMLLAAPAVVPQAAAGSTTDAGPAGATTASRPGAPSSPGTTPGRPGAPPSTGTAAGRPSSARGPGAARLGR